MVALRQLAAANGSCVVLGCAVLLCVALLCGVLCPLLVSHCVVLLPYVQYAPACTLRRCVLVWVLRMRTIRSS